MADRREPSPKRSGANFWAVGGFKETVKRIEQTKHLSELLEDMVNERAMIENKHAEKLKSWSNFFFQQIVASGEYGSMLEIWKESLKEGQLTYKYHERAANQLSQLAKSIHRWRKNRYKRSGFGSEYNIVEDMRERFIQAQSSHKNNMEKVKHYWKCYQDSIEVYETCVRRMRKHPSPENEVKVNAARLNGQTTKSQLLFAYQRLNEGKTDYVNRMDLQFMMADKQEMERMEFFKTQLEDFVKITDILDTGNYEKYIEAMKSVYNYQTDLQDWRDMYGPGQDIKAAWPKVTDLHPFTEDTVYDAPTKRTQLAMEEEPPKSQKSKHAIVNMFHKLHRDKSPNRRVPPTPPVLPPSAMTFTNRVGQQAKTDGKSPPIRPNTPTPDGETRIKPLRSAWHEEDDDGGGTTGATHSATSDDEWNNGNGHRDDQIHPVQTIEEYFAIADYDSKADDEISFRQGDVLILEYTFSPFYNYYHSKHDTSKAGYAPTSHLEKLDSKT